MALGNFYLTAAGNELLAKAQVGASLTITRAQIGEGVWPEGTTYDNITALVAPIKYLTIASKTMSSGQAKLSIQFTNEGVGRPFKWTEFALWAANPDAPDDRGQDILYGTAYAQDTPVPIEAALTEFLFNVLIKTGQATNVTIVIDSSLVYMTRTETEILIDQKIAELDLANLIRVEIVDITIPAEGWELDESEANPDFPLCIQVAVPQCKAEDYPVITLNHQSLLAAFTMGLCPTAEAQEGTIKFWARNNPTNELHGTALLQSKSGGGGSSGGGGQYVLQPATSESLGGVIVGDNLSITPEGRLSAEKVPQMATSEDMEAAMDEVLDKA